MEREREKNKKNRTMGILAAAVCVVTVLLTSGFFRMRVFAAESVVEERITGTISIQLTDGKEGTSKEGIRFYCEMVGSVSEGQYELHPKYQESDVDLNALETAAALREAAEKLAGYENEAAKSDVTDQDGRLTFPNLEVGVYLIRAEDTAKYDAIEPSLIIIPTWNESEKEMLYDVNIVPKHTPEKDAPKETPKKEKPKTGVTESTEPYIVCIAGSLCVAGMVVRAGRKKNRNGR